MISGCSALFPLNQYGNEMQGLLILQATTLESAMIIIHYNDNGMTYIEDIGYRPNISNQCYDILSGSNLQIILLEK